MDEPISRLLRLRGQGWSYVCRMDEAWDELARTFGAANRTRRARWPTVGTAFNAQGDAHHAPSNWKLVA